MAKILNQFSFHPVDYSARMYAGVVFLWILVLACALNSIASQPFNKAQRWFWSFLVIAVPLLGLLCYLPFSFKKSDYPFLISWKRKK